MTPSICHNSILKRTGLTMRTTVLFLALFLLAGYSASNSQINVLATAIEVEGPIDSNTQLGTSMLGLGDINNDGWADFAVGAGGPQKAFIYFGGPGILDGIPDLVLEGGGAMAMGDVNGDGYRDLVTVKRRATPAALDTLYLYLGHSPGPLKLDTIPTLRIAGENPADNFGQILALGDLNDDGYDDLVVGAPDFQYKGKVYVYMGKTIPSGIPDFTGVGDSVDNAYGYTVKIADFNGDSIADLAVSSTKAHSLAYIDIFRGRSDWIFSQNDFSQRLNWRTTPTTVFSFDVADVNVDGSADISVSANPDTTLVFFGRPDSILPTPGLFITNPDHQLYGGMDKAVDVGDVTHDGRKDFVITTGGGTFACVLLYVGSHTPASLPIASRCKGFVTDAFQTVWNVGDVTGDGVEDFGGGAPHDPIPELPQPGYFVIFRGDSNYITDVPKEQTLPLLPGISQNYPNPFNPGTTIQYRLTERAFVHLIVYDQLGREIVRLVGSDQEPGEHRVGWDGKDRNGIVVSSGVYYYRLMIDGVTAATNKLLHIK